MRRLVLVAVGLGLTLGLHTAAAPQQPAFVPPAAMQLNRFYYYPYYYFPHNYWPTMSPRWPEQPGQPYMRPPAYQAYPAFKEPDWRHELWTPQKFHRGSHFWLDQF